MATAEGNDRDERSVDVETHGLGETRKHDLFGGAFSQHDEAREVEFGVGAYGLADEFGRVFLADGKGDRADSGRSLMRIEPEVPDLGRIHPREDARGMAGNHGLRLRRLRQILNLPNDARKIEWGAVVLGLFDRDERERR